jgi:hypothetical protein
LPFNSEGRYLDDEEGNGVCCWVHNNAHLGLQVGNLRRTGLPQLERRGNMEPLGIPTAAGLVELVHVVFFPNNIVGSEFNFHGPRLSRLAHYVSAKAGHIHRSVEFLPLLRQDVLNQLDRLKDVRLFQIKMRASFADVVAEADRDLGSAFAAAAKAGGAETIEVILSPKPYSRESISDKILSLVKKLAKRTDTREEVSRFIVKGFDDEAGRTQLIDIMSDKLISKKQIVLQDKRTRALDPDSTFKAIVEAHAELKDQLHSAAAVSS